MSEQRSDVVRGGWQSLADTVASHARDYLEALAAVGRGEGNGEVVPLLLLEVSQVLLAGAQLGASRDVIPAGNAEPDVGADPDLDAMRSGLASRLANCDEYAELFDPYRDSAPTAFRLSDDLAAVAADLIHGLRHYEAGRPGEALWWWQFSYVNHWGTHGGAALRALHAVVAHASLDVAEENIPALPVLPVLPPVPAQPPLPPVPLLPRVPRARRGPTRATRGPTGRPDAPR